MIFVINEAAKQNYVELAEIWEASVRATHHFIPESYIQKIRPLLLDEYFDQVDLYCIHVASDIDKIIGFSGILGDKIEMLFVSPKWFGQGAGAFLINHAINQLGVTTVDVNEQNSGACLFYTKLGFIIESRSETDGMGKPFLILHLKYHLAR